MINNLLIYNRFNIYSVVFYWILHILGYFNILLIILYTDKRETPLCPNIGCAPSVFLQARVHILTFFF